MLGMIPIFFNIKDKDKLINTALSFASGVMASVSLNSLLKESYLFFMKGHTFLGTIILLLIFTLLGVLISIVINKIFKYIDNKLYKLGIISSLALIIHNIPEGILTFSATSTNVSLGLVLALSIMFHNIPEGISVSIPIYYSTNSKLKAFFYTFISGFSEIVGAIITYLFLFKYINYNFLSIILALTIGIMLYISFFELLPTALSYKNKKRSLCFFIIGYIFMLFFK